MWPQKRECEGRHLSIKSIKPKSNQAKQTQRKTDMKRGINIESNYLEDKKSNITKDETEEEEEKSGFGFGFGFSLLGEDMMFEIFKHVDSRTLARASCVNKKWRKVSNDERLWEIMCSRHWCDIGCSKEQLRSVILAFGGFRLLHSQYMRPILKVSSNTHELLSSSSTPVMGRDEFQLSLSLLSIRYYERMDCNFEGRRRESKKLKL